jgi:hypothetical protein
MIIEKTDPITGNDVKDLEHAPFVIEGSGESALKIYFESEESKQRYLSIEMKELSQDIVAAYNKSTGTGMEM